MKRQLFFSGVVLSFLALSFAKAQNIQFEDANFKAALLFASPENGIAKDVNGNPVAIDVNGDGEISQEEALNIYQLSTGRGKIVSMKEIEYFTNLTRLNCLSFYMLKNLDISKNINLQTLWLSNIKIETLDLSKNTNLQSLNLSFIKIKTLDLSKNINLQSLDLSFTQIRTLDLSKNINLQKLDLSYNYKLQTLNLSKNINLQKLDLSDPRMKTFDVLKNISLQELSLSGARMKTLDVSKNINLQGLWLNNIRMKTLDISKNINLRSLNISKNIDLLSLNNILYSIRIKTLDISKNINLQTLDLYNTKIETLDVSHNINLVSLNLTDCSKLTSLYMKNGVKKIFNYPSYNNYDFRWTNLKYICCDEDEIDTVKDYMQNLGEKKLLANSWQMSNLTVTSDCGTADAKEILPK